MATIFNSDLETETSAFETEWDSKTEEGSNTLAISTTEAHVHAGTNGAIIDFDGTNNGCWAEKAVSDQDEMYCRVYVKANAAFAADGTYKPVIFLELKDGVQFLARVAIRSTAAVDTFVWYAQYWTGIGTTTLTIPDGASLDAWHLVELHWTAGTGADGGIELKVDGTSLDSDFSGAMPDARCDTIRVGASSAGGAVPTDASELYFDDFASDDTSWVGGTGATVSFSATVAAVTTTGTAGDGLWDMGPFIYTGGSVGAATLHITHDYSATVAAAVATGTPVLNVATTDEFSATIAAVVTTGTPHLLTGAQLSGIDPTITSATTARTTTSATTARTTASSTTARTITLSTTARTIHSK